MKNQINIWNQNTGNETVTITQLRSRILQRRMDALNPLGKNSVKKEITVMTTNKELKQVAAHYKIFEIKTFGHSKAVEVYNAGGGQKASLIN